jgi:hypothetical protein
MRKVITNEERVAKSLSNLFSDLRLDLVAVAMYVADLNPNVTINRILLTAELIQDEKGAKHNDYI